MNCKNCGERIDAKFCKHCGQNTKVDKINLYTILRDISQGVFQMEKGFFFSMSELFIRPGKTIRNYLKGKRKNHFKPVAYVFTLSTIYFLVSRQFDTGTFVEAFLEGASESMNSDDSEIRGIVQFEWFIKHYAITILMLIPIFSLASFFAFYRSGYNYFEHVVLNSYITGQQATIYIFASLMGLVFGQNSILISLIQFISLGYVFIVFWQFFNELSRFQVFLKSILTYLIFLILLTVMAIILGLVLSIF